MMQREYTYENLVPAQRMYEIVGFKLYQRRENEDSLFAGDYINYVYLISS